MIICDCDLIIPDIPKEECRVNIGEILKVAFASEEETGFDPESNILNLAFWELRIKAIGAQKVVVSPFFRDGGMNPGAPIEEDGLNNVKTVEGFNPTIYEGFIRAADPEIIVALKTYACQSSVNVYLFNDRGEIVHSTSGTAAKGIRATNFKVLDRNVEKNVFDKNLISFEFAYCWDSNITVVKPNFDPLTDLDNIDLDVNNAIWSTPNNLIWSTGENVTYS